MLKVINLLFFKFFKSWSGTQIKLKIHIYLMNLKFKTKGCFIKNLLISVWEDGGSPLKVYSLEKTQFRPIYAFTSLMNTQLALK